MPSLLPNAKAQFVDANGLPLVGGTVGYYSPSTLNPLPTYQDQAGTIANTNPISLDSRGQAIIWGSGVFRQIVKDINGVTIWDQIVASADSAFSASTGASLVGFDGTNLANQFLSRVNRVVDSIAALRSLSKATYTRAFVTGYYAPHDGGGGAYQYDPADTTTADNSGTVIVAADGGRWKLMHNGTVSVCQFGARGTSAVGALVDDTAAFRLAVATGLTVHIPVATTYFRLTNAVTVTTPGQVIMGDGKDVSVVQIDTSFNMSATGVFVLASIQPCPQLRDFKITFIQPDTATRASLTTYPPAVYAQNQPRFVLNGMKITQATFAVDMRGNSGGALISNCELSAYNYHIYIDGSQDSVKIQSTHIWPFDMTANQIAVYQSLASVGIYTGRCDDLHVDDCLLFSGSQIVAVQTANGTTFGGVTNTDFDSTWSLNISAGELSFAGCYFSIGIAAAQWLVQTGGDIRFAACKFTVGLVPSSPCMTISGGATASALFSACTFATGVADQQTMVISSSSGSNTAQFMGCRFIRTPAVNFAHPTLEAAPGGRLVVTSCSNLDKGGGLGNFIALDSDDQHIISNNSFAGWGASLPASYVALRCEGNTGIAGATGQDIQNNYVVGNIRTKVFYGTTSGTGTVNQAHNIASAAQKSLMCMGWYKGPSGEMKPLTLTSLDSANASFSGGTASVAYRIVITYTETQQGW